VGHRCGASARGIGEAAPWNRESLSQLPEGVASLLGVRVQTASSDRKFRNWMTLLSSALQVALRTAALFGGKVVRKRDGDRVDSTTSDLLGLCQAGTHVMDAALRDNGIG
jgi:hypothetical protein